MESFIVILIIVFLLLGVVTYKQNYYNFKRQELDVNAFFFKDIKHLNHSNKRKLWVHIPIERNSRKWEQFGSRSSYNLNSDYLLLCMKSIIDHCAQYYDVILFDDSNLNTLLPGQNVDYEKLSGELLEKYRQKSLLTILYEYGGVMLPSHIYLKKSIYLVDKPNAFYVCEIPNQGESSSLGDFVYSTKIMGSNKNNPILGEYINKYSTMCVKDLTNESKYFSDQLLKKMDIPLLHGKIIGTRDKKGNPIVLEDLMEQKSIVLSSSNVGLYIPRDELMRRTKYNWYVYLNSEQVLETNVFISKYMLEHGKSNVIT